MAVPPLLPRVRWPLLVGTVLALVGFGVALGAQAQTTLKSSGNEVAVQRKAADNPGGADALVLSGPAPNPAHQQATVRLSIPESMDEEARLRLYDITGRKIRTLMSGAKSGRHQVLLSVGDLPSGVYVLHLTAGDQVRTQKLTVLDGGDTISSTQHRMQ